MSISTPRFTMKRVIPAATLILLLGTAAYASNVHLKKSPPLTFVDNGLTLTEAVSLTGLGGGNLSVNLVTTADAATTCTNQGGNQSPGQNPAPVTSAGSTIIPSSQIKNGNVSFSVTTVGPISPIPNAPDCANTNWSETYDDLLFKTADLTVGQDDGTGTFNIVFTLKCTFAPPTQTGTVPTKDVTCS